MPSDRVLHFYLLHHFGTDIYDPNWRPNPSMQTENQFAYRAALMAPSILQVPPTPSTHLDKESKPYGVARPIISKFDMFGPSEINAIAELARNQEGQVDYNQMGEILEERAWASQTTNNKTQDKQQTMMEQPNQPQLAGNERQKRDALRPSWIRTTTKRPRLMPNSALRGRGRVKRELFTRLLYHGMIFHLGKGILDDKEWKSEDGIKAESGQNSVMKKRDNCT